MIMIMKSKRKRNMERMKKIREKELKNKIKSNDEITLREKNVQKIIRENLQ